MKQQLAIMLVVGGCADSASQLARLEQPTTVCGSGPTLKGVDVSYYQGAIDWPAVKADGVEFAFVRVSDGTGFEDPRFEPNWAGARANGIVRGAYQYFRPNQDPIAQADLLLEHLGTPDPDDLPPVIDVENTGNLAPDQIEANVRVWIDRVAAATAKQPIIYTGLYFWRDEVGSPDLTSSPLWHAQYTSAACPSIAPPWTEWAFWQFTSSGKVAGIAGNVDLNRFNGTREQLTAMTGEPRVCGTIAADGGAIDDGDPCFQAGGPQAYLRGVSDAGAGGDLIWTHATDAATEANFATWNLVFAEPGRYEFAVATPAAYAQSTKARYSIRVAGVTSDVMIDQTAVDGYQTLGEFDVVVGGDQYVHLGDNTGEARADDIQLVFDTVRITRIDPPSDDPGDAVPPDETGCSTGGGAGFAIAIALGLAVRRRRVDTRNRSRVDTLTRLTSTATQTLTR